MRAKLGAALGCLAVIAAMPVAAAQTQPGGPSFAMATDLLRTCRQFIAPQPLAALSPQDVVDLFACWSFIGGMRGMVTVYEKIVLGGPAPARPGGGVICMPPGTTFEQTFQPVAAELRAHDGELPRLQSHVLVFAAWTRAFPCQ
jgi:hypothetical protein